MLAKAIVSILLVAACAHYSESIPFYFQSANYDLLPCQNIDCKTPKDKPNDFDCELEWKVDRKTTRVPIYLKHLEGNNYRIIFQSKEIKNVTLEITNKGFVRKVKAIPANPTAENAKNTTTCATQEKKLTDEQRKSVLEFCNEEGMKFVDNSNC